MQNDTNNNEDITPTVDPLQPNPGLDTNQPTAASPAPAENTYQAQSQLPTQPITPSQTPAPVQTPTFFTNTPVADSPVEPQTVPVQPPKKSKKKLIIILGIIVAVLALLIGGAVAAYNVWYQNPEKVVTDALVNSVTAKTATLTGTFDVKNKDYAVKVAIDGKSSTDSSELSAKVEYTTNGKTFKVDGAGQLGSDGNLYVKANNLRETIDSFTAEQGADYSMFDDLITKVDGKWIKITSDDIKSFSADYEKAQKCVQDATNQLKTNKKLGNEVYELYKKNNFVIVKDSLGSRTVNGVGSLGYVIDLDKDKVKTFAAGLDSTEVGKKLKACDDSYDFKAFADDIDTTDDEKTGDGTIQLWASRFGHEVTEINAAGKDDDTEIKAVINPIFNKEVKIDTPTDAMTIESLQAEIEKVYTQYYTEAYTQSSATTLYN